MTSITGHAPASYADLTGLMSLMTGAEKHTHAASSTLDVLWVLYDQVLRVTPETVDDQHPGPVPALQGPWADGLLRGAGREGVHRPGTAARLRQLRLAARAPPGPDRLLPGVEIGSGSLGHGLPLAVGTALGLRAPGLRCTLGPPLRCGCWSATRSWTRAAPRGPRLRRGAAQVPLHTVVIDNDSATHGWRGGIASRFEAGAGRRSVDGRARRAPAAAFTRRTRTVPPWPSSPSWNPSTRSAHHQPLRRHPIMRQPFFLRPTALLTRTAPRGRDRRHLRRRLRAGPPRPPGPGGERRHAGAAADRRGRRDGADRAPADRPHLRQLPGRTPF